MDSLPVRNLARFNSNGTWDSAWNPKLYEGVSALDFGAFGGQFEISALAFDSHRNRLYVGMNDRLLFIDPDERGNVLKVSSLNEDIHFESEGEGDIDIISLAIDSSGRLYVGGQHDIEGGFLVRYNTNDEGDGKIDVNWGPEYGGDVSTLVFDSNGQLYVAGPSLRRFNTSPGGDDHIDKDWNPRSNK
jgi:ligand-binding sensor domain-containing protein